VSRLPDDPLYLVDANAVKFGDLCPRHPVTRQRTDPADLRRKHRAAPPSRDWRSPDLFGFGSGFVLSLNRHPRRDGKDTGLTARLLIAWGGAVWRRLWRVGCRILMRRFEQIFSGLASSSALLAIIPIVRRLPFGHRAFLHRKTFISHRI
jgi:hypothetical protein